MADRASVTRPTEPTLESQFQGPHTSEQLPVHLTGRDREYFTHGAQRGAFWNASTAGSTSGFRFSTDVNAGSSDAARSRPLESTQGGAFGYSQAKVNGPPSSPALIIWSPGMPSQLPVPITVSASSYHPVRPGAPFVETHPCNDFPSEMQPGYVTATRGHRMSAGITPFTVGEAPIPPANGMYVTAQPDSRVCAASKQQPRWSFKTVGKSQRFIDNTRFPANGHIGRASDVPETAFRQYRN